MMTEFKTDETYGDALAQFGKEVFKEFLGELSRKRQASLLASAAITILLTFAIVEPVESQFAGIKFKFSNVEIIPIIAAIFCAYFMVTYLISALQDWQLEKYRTMPARTSIEKYIDQVMVVFQEREATLSQKADEIRERRDVLSKARNEIEAKKEEIDETLAALRKRHDAALERAKKKGTSPAKLEALRKKQLLKQWETMFLIVNVPGLPNAIIKTRRGNKTGKDDDPEDAVYEYANERFKELEKAIYRYVYFRNINVVIEIIFPSLLALFAIGSVIWKISN